MEKNTRSKIYSSLGLILGIVSLVLLVWNIRESYTKKPYERKEQSLSELVNPFIGTGFHGHTYPGASLPFGLVQLSPDTRKGNWDACSGYHYSDSTILGFSHTHLSGTGCIELGDILIKPITWQGNDIPKSLDEPLSFQHKNEEASPAYYSVLLDNGVKAELTATTHVGLHRYTFPKTDDLEKHSAILIDLAHLLDNEHIYTSELKQTHKREVVGMRSTRGWVDKQQVYFVVQTSEDIFATDEYPTNNEGKKLLCSFKNERQKPIVLKVGLSLVSIDEARTNLEAEVGAKTFDEIKDESAKIWEKALSKIEIRGESREDEVIFYTALYHSMLAPNQVSDVSGSYRTHKDEVAKLDSGIYYSTLSTWDTFRAWSPMMTLLDTDLINNIIRSSLIMYQNSGELPLWPLASGETETMIGYHTASIIADAYMKGIRDYDAELALEAMIASSEKNKKGADYYIKNGFIPSNIKRESVSCLLEFAYDDWCIARMAEAMGKQKVYDKYIARAKNYINVFDGATKFFRPKRLDGNWESPFDTETAGRAYTEATAWQYRFFVPHDVTGLMNLMGGREEFLKALDDLFVQKTKEEPSELQDITGLIGQYAHGNEPSHHVPYLYTLMREGWKTQELTRRILKEMYSAKPEGIIGNEDCGQMSAWYIMSSLGLYSFCPASNQFILTTPLFPYAKINLANGKSLEIKANEPSKNKYIKSVKLNGKALERDFVTYDELMVGGELKFELSAKPNKERDVNFEQPYSMTTGLEVSIPYVKEDLDLFEEQTSVSLASATEGAKIYYTLDGSRPNDQSKVYTESFTIDKSCEIRAIAYKDEYQPSAELKIKATKAEYRKPSVKDEELALLNRGYITADYYEANFRDAYDLFHQTEGLILRGSISPISSEELANISIDGAKSEDHFGYIFKGAIYIAKKGVYDFQTKSDDGSRLFIGDSYGEYGYRYGLARVVDNDGSHAAITANGRIALDKGWHKFIVAYFEDYEGQHLSWSWKQPDSKNFEPIPNKVLASTKKLPREGFIICIEEISIVEEPKKN